MALKIGDICISVPGFTADCYVITGKKTEHPTATWQAFSVIRKTYYVIEEQELIKIGELSQGLEISQIVSLTRSPPAVPSETDLEFLEGQEYARYRARIEAEPKRSYWGFLGEAKPGAVIPICLGGGRHEHVTFQRVLPEGKKYVFLAADKKGRVYRYPLGVIVLPQVPPLPK